MHTEDILFLKSRFVAGRDAEADQNEQQSIQKVSVIQHGILKRQNKKLFQKNRCGVKDLQLIKITKWQTFYYIDNVQVTSDLKKNPIRNTESN